MDSFRASFVRVFGASMRGKLFVPQCLEVPHHRIEVFAHGGAMQIEDPSILRAAPPAKVRFVQSVPVRAARGIISKTYALCALSDREGRAGAYESYSDRSYLVLSKDSG